VFRLNLPYLPNLMLSGAVSGLHCGLLPLLTGVARQRRRLGLAGLFTCVIFGVSASALAAPILGFEVAASAAVAFFCVILLVSGPPPPKGRAPREESRRGRAAAGQRQHKRRPGDTRVTAQPGGPSAAGRSGAVTPRRDAVRRATGEDRRGG
jgi:hypothetical protein